MYWQLVITERETDHAKFYDSSFSACVPYKIFRYYVYCKMNLLLMKGRTLDIK